MVYTLYSAVLTFKPRLQSANHKLASLFFFAIKYFMFFVLSLCSLYCNFPVLHLVVVLAYLMYLAEHEREITCMVCYTPTHMHATNITDGSKSMR